MKYNKITIYKKDNRKYKLVRILSGIISPIMIASTLAGCVKNDDDYNKFDSNDKQYTTEQNNNYDYSFDFDFDYYNPSDSNESSNEKHQNNEINQNNNTNSNQYKENNLTLNVDEDSIAIINNKIVLNNSDILQYTNYLKNIYVSYPYSELFQIEASLNKYYSLSKYQSSCENLFTNNIISSDIIYSIVKRNNANENLADKAIMGDYDLKYVCAIIANVLNDYVKNNPKINLNNLSEKINNLKILKFDDFSNGYFDATTGRMGFNISYLRSKSENFYKNTIEHETYHFIQASTIKEANELNYETRYGFSYKFFDTKVNSLSWDWYYEGSAEYLVCDYNNDKNSEVYDSLIKSIDTIKVATVLSQENDVYLFENLSTSSNLDDLFNYFGCETKDDKIEVLNLMYSYNILFDLNSTSSSNDFYKLYKEKNSTYMSGMDNVNFERELKGSIAQTLSKKFYSNLTVLISNKEISIKEIFSLISIFENEMSRQISYNSSSTSFISFYNVYNDIQTNFFEMIADELAVNVYDVQHAYNVFNANVDVNVNDLTVLSDKQKDFYAFIVNTRENNKINSINYVGRKLGFIEQSGKVK